MYFSQNSGVVDYIIKRIYDRIKSMQKARLLFINTVTIDELKQNKSIMIKHFLEIEDDLKQSSQALSSMMIQNKDLVEEKENYDIIIRRNELKTFSLEKAVNDVNSKYGDISEVNDNLRGRLIDYDKIIIEANERISNL